MKCKGFIVLVLASAVGVAAFGFAQDQRQRDQISDLALKQLFRGDAMSVTNITPRSSSNTGYFLTGEQMTFSVETRNLTSAATIQNVKLRLQLNNGQIIKEETLNIGHPNDVFKWEPLWTAQPGPWVVTCTIEVPGEAPAFQANNTKTANFEVFKTGILDYNEAKNAGATFEKNPESQLDPSEREWRNISGGQATTNWQEGVYFRQRCTPVTPGRSNPEAFKNFDLKNGWFVQNVQWEKTVVQGHADAQNTSQPAKGSRNTYTKFHVTGEPGSMIDVMLRITIAGPQDKNPYR